MADFELWLRVCVSLGPEDESVIRKTVAEVAAAEREECGKRTPVKIGGSGKVKKTWGGGEINKLPLEKAMALQGIPPDWNPVGLTATAKKKAVGNAVPIWLGRALARGVMESMR